MWMLAKHRTWLTHGYEQGKVPAVEEISWTKEHVEHVVATGSGERSLSADKGLQY